MNPNTLLIFSIFVINTLDGEVFYENPFQHQASFKPNNYVISRSITIKDNVKRDVTEKGEYLGDNNWRETETTIPETGTPSITVLDTKRNEKGVSETASSRSSTGMDFSGRLGAVIGSKPKSKLVKKGQTWEIEEHATVDLNLGSVLPSGVETLDGGTEVQYMATQKSSYEMLGLETIYTIWGHLDALKIRVQSEVKLKPSVFLFTDNSGTYGYIKQTEVEIDSDETRYYIKGFGLYRSSSTTETKSFIQTAKEVSSYWATEKKEVTPRKTETEQYLVESTNLSINPLNFSPVDLSTNSNQTYLNSWTWMGQFPWVYNSETNSWFYYHFSGDTCNAWDARANRWYTFHSESSTWR